MRQQYRIDNFANGAWNLEKSAFGPPTFPKVGCTAVSHLHSSVVCCDGISVDPDQGKTLDAVFDLSPMDTRQGLFTLER
jgi:hypothetical protein